MLKKDDLKFGLLIGFIAPLLSMVIYYFVRFREFSIADVFGLMAREKNQITAIVIPCLLLNIILFTFYVNTRRDQTAKGIFTVTLIFAIAGLLVKFLI